MNPVNVAKIVGKALVNKSPSIFSGFAIACFIGATISAAVITPKVVKRVNAAKEQKKKELMEQDETLAEEETEETLDQMEHVALDYLEGMTLAQTAEKYDISKDEVKSMVRLYKKRKKEEKAKHTPGLLSKWEICKLAAPMYLPAFFMTLFGIGGVVAANKVHLDRTMAAVAACELSGNALKEYQEKATEKFGEKADKEIRDEIAKDQVTKKPPDPAAVIDTTKGPYWCYEPISEQYFLSCTNDIRGAVYNVRDALTEEGWCSVNDYLHWLSPKLKPMKKVGDNLGWRACTPSETKVIFDPYYTRWDDDDEYPVLVVRLEPQPDYRYK